MVSVREVLDVSSPAGVVGTVAWVTVLYAVLKVIDLVAAATDEVGCPVALSPLGYPGGVNESV